MTTDTSPAATPPSRARRLKQATTEVHDQLDRKVMNAASFDTRAGYGRFVRMQWAFHRDIAGLYEDTRLRALLPDLPDRASLALIEADLADLGLDPPVAGEMPRFPAGQSAPLPEALGWLYVAEGSNMGAALLRKEAAKLGLSDDFGARHLAPAPEGPAAHWRRFTAALDAVKFTEAEEAQVTAGAKQAFAHVHQLAETCLG